jgi:predicted transcriptional regulator
MENNMMKIAERVYKLVKQQELITEDTEFHILYQIADELLSEMGEIEQYENVKKTLVNMFIVFTNVNESKSSNLKSKYKVVASSFFIQSNSSKF